MLIQITLDLIIHFGIVMPRYICTYQDVSVASALMKHRKETSQTGISEGIANLLFPTSVQMHTYTYTATYFIIYPHRTSISSALSRQSQRHPRLAELDSADYGVRGASPHGPETLKELKWSG